jgi:hypothetical protein
MQRITIALLLCVWWTPRLSHAELTFKVPAGWVDLSANAPEANFRKAPPMIAAQARAQKLAFFAADVKHANDGFMENVNAVLVNETLPINELTVAKVTENMDAEIKKQSPLASMKILEAKIVQIGGADCARLVALLSLGPQTIQQVTYILPGHRQHAILTFSTVPAQFTRYQPIFDAAARATGGLEKPE